jgi:hypothetical protein
MGSLFFWGYRGRFFLEISGKDSGNFFQDEKGAGGKAGGFSI